MFRHKLREVPPSLSRLLTSSAVSSPDRPRIEQAYSSLRRHRLAFAASVFAAGCTYLYARQSADMTLGAAAGALDSKQATHASPPPSAASQRPFVLLLDLDTCRFAEDVAKPSVTILEALSIMSSLAPRKRWLQLSQVVDALRHAGEDERVQGLVAIIGEGEAPERLAQVQELQDAVLHFRRLKQDKVPTIAYTDSFEGVPSGASLGYYLATAFDQIVVQPGGFVCLLGLAEETLFFQGLLDKLQVKPLPSLRGEYKTAYNFVTHKGYSKAHREASQAWLNSCMKQIVGDVAVARGLSYKQVLDLFNSFPLTAEAAAAMGLIDGVKSKIDATHYITHHTCGQAAAAQQTSPSLPHQDDVAGRQTSEQPTASHPVSPAGDQMLAAAQRFQKGTAYVTTVAYDSSSTEACTYMPFTAYMALLEAEKICKAKDKGNKPGIALIRISGEIASGSCATVGGKIDSHQICEDLRSAAEAEHVQAVVLRIDTPGGLGIASREIWDELMQVKASGKPVIASMGNVAASGGYYIAAAADGVVAQPGTITGSIGVIDGKLNLAPALKQLGIDVGTVSVGKNALMESWYTDVTRKQQRWADSMLDRFYKDFIDKVAAGRNMRAEEVARVAKGRIWTGRDAYQLGLVDELGGLTKAIALAKQMAELPQDDEAVNILEWNSIQQSMSSAPLGSAVTVPSGPFATSRTRSQTGSEALALLLA